MVLAVDKLINDDRFCGENVLHFLLYLPIGLILMAIRTLIGLILWVASIILPNKSAVRQFLSILACWTFGVFVRVRGRRDPRCSVLVANYVSCLDSLAVAHVLGTISLRKWKVPPFFASSLGIKNVAQFATKQHFAESPSKPVLLQPEGGPTNGKGLLLFTDWPFQLGNRVQPVAITVERLFTNVTVHRASDTRTAIPWSDALWFLWTPITVFRVHALPAMDRGEDSEATFSERVRQTLADALKVEVTPYRWEELGAAQPHHDQRMQQQRHQQQTELVRQARRVHEVLPRVPLADIVRDLAATRSVDVTITNFLEGVTPYTPEPEPEPAPWEQQQRPAAERAPPKYVTPRPTGAFPRSARERQLSFQERKAQMIADARRRYIEKHCLRSSDC